MKALLLIADGLGWRGASDGNAVCPETMPVLFGLAREHGVALLEASGEHVGLGPGQVGNSEAGHLTIGAGTRVPSLLTKIGEDFESGGFAQSPVWDELAGEPYVHVVGLLSDAGVHGYWPNLVRTALVARQRGVGQVFVHAVLDGVDSQAGSAPALLGKLLSELEGLSGVACATVMGRRWACDRSGDLELTRVLVDHLSGRHEVPGFELAELEQFIAEGGIERDFPCRHLAGRFVNDDEPVILTNHRADRSAQVARVFAETHPVYSLVELEGAVAQEHVFFPKQPLTRGVAFELAARDVASVRVAEQCKFPHVTYFFNGFNDALGEDACCLDSVPEAEIPDRPEMSAREVANTVLELLAQPGQRAIVANLANADQVGHSGRIDAARRAVRAVDCELERLAAGCREHGWNLLVTSDHGNAETMLDAAGEPLGSHSTSPVPFISVPALSIRQDLVRETGSLSNVGATFLGALGIPAPDWMEPSLVSYAGAEHA